MRFKKMNKKIFTLLLLVFVLISMSAVSSADLNDTDSALAVSDSSNIVAALANNNSDVLGINENQDTLQVPDSGDDVLGVGSQFVSFECPSSMDEGDTSKMATFLLWDEQSMEIDAGTVWLNCDGVNILSTTPNYEGEGSFSLASLTSGTHSLKCVYEGNGQWEPCESANKTITVGGISPVIIKTEVYLITYDETTINMSQGENRVFKVIVSEDEQESQILDGVNVTLTADKTVVSAITDDQGEASLNLSTIPAGVYNAIVDLNSDEYEPYETLSLTLTVNGDQPPSGKTKVYLLDTYYKNPVTIVEGSDINFTVTVSKDNYGGDTIMGVNVTLTANETVVSAITDNSGEASLSLSTIPAGSYAAAIDVVSDTYEADTFILTLTVNGDQPPVPPVVNKTTDWYWGNMMPVGQQYPLTVEYGSTIPNTYAEYIDEDYNYYYLPDGTEVTVNVGNSYVINAVVDGYSGQFNVVLENVLPGIYDVTFSAPGYTNSTGQLTVTKKSTEINMTTNPIELKVNQEVNINATLIPNVGNLTYESDNTDVATVDELGNVVAKGEGTANITVSFAGDDTYAAAEDQTITVTVTLNDASVIADDMELKVGENGTISYTTSPSGLNVSFVVDDSGVVEVDANGTVTALKKGTAQVTVLVGDGKKYALNSTVINVTVQLKDASVIAEDMELTVGETGVVNYTTTPPGLNVTFVYYDSGIISVDKNGTVTALKAGTTNVIVVVGDDKIYTLNLTEINVTVNLKDANWTYIDVHTGNESELDGAKFLRQWIHSPITCFVKDANGTGLPAGTNITIFCQGDENYTINTVAQEDGKFTVNVSDIALGEYKVTFHADDYTDATAKITIIKALTEINVKNETVSLKAGEEVGSGATLTPADAGNLTYTSSNSTVAVVVDGKIKALAAGNATITVSFAGNDKYFAAENKTIEVTVTLNDAKWTYIIGGKEYELDGHILYLPWNYSPITCFVKDANGTGLPAGTNITIFCQGDKNYTINSVVQDDGKFSVDISDIALGWYNVTFSAEHYATATARIKIIKGLTDITVENETVSLKAGEEVGSGATLTPADAGNLTYTSSNSTVAVVVDGKIKALAAGNATITVSFAGNDKYFAAENKTIEVTVTLNDAKWTYIIGGKEYELDGDTLMLPLNYSPTCFVKDANNTGLPAGTNITIFCNGDENYTINSIVQDDGQFSVDMSDIALGKYNVTFSAGNDYTTATATVTILKGLTEINVENETVSLKAGEEVGSGATLTPADAGNLTYTSSNESVAVVVDGKIKSIAAGTANITVSFAGNDRYYAAANKTIAVTVTLNDARVSAEDMALKVGDNATISYITDPTGLNVTFVEDDSGVVEVSDDGTVTALKNGTARITINVGDNKKYALNSTVITVTVTLNDASVSAENMTLTIGENGTIDYITDPTGLNVTFVEDDSGVVGVSNNGTVTALKAGTAQITVLVGDGKKYAMNSTVVTVTVNKISTEINVGNTNVTLNALDSVDANATLTPADAGNLTYTSSNENVVQVNGGKIIAVGKGTATVTVSFNGTDKYAAAESKTIEVTVNINNASVTAEDITLTVDENATINATTTPEGLPIEYVVDDSGIVEVDENGVVTALKGGTAEITLIVGDNKTYTINSTTITVTVNKIDTSIVVENKTLELYVDDEGHIVATLNPGGGDLNFTSSDDSVVTVDNFGDFNAVAEGSATIIVSFAGDDKYNAAENVTVTVKVSKIDTSIEFNYDTINLTVHNETIVVADLNPPEAGNVTYTSSNPSVVTVDSEGNVEAVGVGNATITASFAGNDKYNEAENVTVLVIVSKIDTKITVDTKSLDLSVGNETAVKGTLTPAEAGNVSYMSNDTSVVTVDENTGKVKAVGAGNANIIVFYDGNADYKMADDVTIPVTVSKVAFEPEIAMANSTLTVAVPENATGNVTLTIGNETFVAPIKDGVASFDLSDVPSGDYNATVAYPGDDKYAGFDIVCPVSIEDNFILIADNVTKYYSGPERFVVNLTDSKGNPIANANISIYINGVNYTRTTDDKGQASMAIGLNAGKYTAVVTYNGTSVDATVTVLPTVNGTDITKMFRNNTQYYATFRDSQGNYLPEGTTVTFNIHGVMYERKVSGDKGLARLNINLEAGEYIITAMNPVTGDMTANNITVLSRITENADLVKYYRNASQYTVKVLGDDGKAVGAGESVTFNINGVFYTRQTDANGIAKININLQPGDYVITSEYKGCVVSNNIKVLPILNATDINMKYRDGTQFKATLVDGQGKPYAGQSVTFNVNGVFYNRPTDSSGTARLNINLMPGEYIITSSYNGSSIANTIKISA